MYVAIDMGGTHTRVASSINLKDVYKVTKFATSKDLRKQVSHIESAIKTVSAGKTVKCVGVGVPGIIDHSSDHFIKVPNVSCLNSLHVSEILPVAYRKGSYFVANDTSLAAYAESVHGSGKDSSRVFYLSIGTGVGGAFIKDRSIHDVFEICEPGHQIIVEDGRVNDSCSQAGCLESYVGGKHFKLIYGVTPDTCTTKKIWDKYASHLAVGVNNILSLYHPDILILGGSLMLKFDYMYKPLISSLDKMCLVPLPKIKLSKFGDNAGLIGIFTATSKLL